MFSFHKPKIYRSNLGCCICKAKSSSSRFTDSQKYENEFERCFRIQERRSGEICNACVLLVKRWKKLSPENRLLKHWHHVVDARAGPGTKLTHIRRLTSSSASASSSTSSSCSSAAAGSSSSQAPASSASNQQQQRHPNQLDHSPSESHRANNRQLSSKSDHLPLTSNQSANNAPATQQQQQQQQQPKRTGSFGGGGGSSSKARAIDTNVSTFTFGETNRRNYMALESAYFSASNSTASNSINKPQSALNSSAFGSVIQRFRQRQQQQQLEANRRQQSRQRRLSLQRRQQQQQQSHPAGELTAATAGGKRPLQPAAAAGGQPSEPEQTRSSHLDTGADLGAETTTSSSSSRQQQQPATKRIKRPSESSIGSLSVDGCRVANLLDASFWRKERTCCGIIFRGLNSELAVFPKLLKPCQQRQSHAAAKASAVVVAAAAAAAAADAKSEVDEDTKAADESHEQRRAESPMRREVSPSPRTTKSDSISSCDSNTSGTGSMAAEPQQPDNQRQPQQPASSSGGGGGKLLQLRRRKRVTNKPQQLDSTAVAAASLSSRLMLLAAANRKAANSNENEEEELGPLELEFVDEHEDELEEEMDEDGELEIEIEEEDDFNSSDGSSNSIVDCSLSSEASERSLAIEGGPRSGKKSSTSNSVVGAAS